MGHHNLLNSARPSPTLLALYRLAYDAENRLHSVAVHSDVLPAQLIDTSVQVPYPVAGATGHAKGKEQLVGLALQGLQVFE